MMIALRHAGDLATAPKGPARRAQLELTPRQPYAAKTRLNSPSARLAGCAA